MRVTHLWVAPYNEYQNFLYETILRLREEGLNFQEIANWMNAKGYLTPRGKSFGNAHAHSIVKKKKNRDVRLTKRYEPKISGFSLRFIDKTVISQ
ncbi:recombinase family protein [bacterium]|nr:recombinase family protein [bacterium]